MRWDTPDRRPRGPQHRPRRDSTLGMQGYERPALDARRVTATHEPDGAVASACSSIRLDRPRRRSGEARFPRQASL